jgi:hypothetical protein
VSANGAGPPPLRHGMITYVPPEPGTQSGSVDVKSVRNAQGITFVRIIHANTSGLLVVDLATSGEQGNVADRIGQAIVREAAFGASGLVTP